MWSHAKEHFFNAGNIPSSNLHLCSPPFLHLVPHHLHLYRSRQLSSDVWNTLTSAVWKRIPPLQKRGIQSKNVLLLITVTVTLLHDPWGTHSIVWTLSGQGSPQGSPEVKTDIIDLTSGQLLWWSPEGRRQVTRMLIYPHYKSLIDIC